MNKGIRTDAQHIEDALDAADMAWWELEFPSGALSFSKKKTDLIGRDKKEFIHFRHFTELIHPEDYEHTMQAMRDHYEGRTGVYETTYRMKHRDGQYVTFHDKGRIVERTDNGFIVAGIIRLVQEA